ncbi:MAG: hypothetical protein J2P44_12575, partial [Candidatus Dormibacteraeota bacterium]|nr:hypothetical protein [Candidatus Dormibacteraeota bacterium]
MALDRPRSDVSQSPLDAAWRVALIVVVYCVMAVPLDLLSSKHSPLTSILICLVTGAGYALISLPLARRLPYPMGTRFLAIFVPLYWIGQLSNLVEAWFDTTFPHSQLIGGAIILAVPLAVTSLLIALLLKADPAVQPVPRIHELLGRRPLLSWAWRILVAGILFAVVLQLAGTLWGPVISRYYRDPAFVAQAHTANPPDYVFWPEETVRGILFALVLLPVLAVMRGRDWRSLLVLGGYVALLNAVIEGWLPMLSMTAFPLQFRL